MDSSTPPVFPGGVSVFPSKVAILITSPAYSRSSSPSQLLISAQTVSLMNGKERQIGRRRAAGEEAWRRRRDRWRERVRRRWKV